MSCGECLRWRPRSKRPGEYWPRASRYGWCRWPGLGAEPYWVAEHPGGDLMTADESGSSCAAYKISSKAIAERLRGPAAAFFRR